MEVPCRLNFMGHDKEVLKIQKLVCGFKVSTSNCEQSSKLTEINGSAENANPDEPIVITDDILPAAKRKRISANASSEQHQITSAVMTNEDLEEIIMGCKLSDKHINHAQNVLKKQFPMLNGLASTLLVSKDIQFDRSSDNNIQIFHTRNDHWITVSSVTCDHGRIKVYDSSFTSLDPTTERLIHKEFHSPGVETSISIVLSQKQKGDKDCGLFAIAQCHFN